MKINEPKTPFVRYNAETDTVEGDIPTLDLYGRHISTISPVTRSPVAEGSQLPPESPTTSVRRPSLSGRSSGGGSSRSTSFNLPDDARFGIRAVRGERGGEVEEEEMDEEALAKHQAFLRARGRHYSNEAEAMKMAKKMMEEEDDESPATGDDDQSIDTTTEDEPPSRPNGVTRG